MNDSLQGLEESLRAAVLSSLFPDVQRLLNCYVAEVERSLREDSLDPPEMRALAARTHGLFEWTGAMLANLREESAAEAARLGFVHSYDAGESPPRQLHTQG